jgi:ribosomal protein S18 acetylase RimI-like enzyme
MKNNTLIIRAYRDEDFPAIDQLWSETGMGGKIRGDDRETIRNTLLQGGRLFVLVDRETGEVIGTSWLTVDGRRIYLHHFGIKPVYQGKGYSRQLLEASLDFARSTGLQIKLEVHKVNERAVRLYEKAGFSYLGDYLVYIIRDYKDIEQ